MCTERIRRQVLIATNKPSGDFTLLSDRTVFRRGSPLTMEPVKTKWEYKLTHWPGQPLGYDEHGYRIYKKGRKFEANLIHWTDDYPYNQPEYMSLYPKQTR